MSDPEDNLFEEGAEETMFDLSSKKKKKKKKVVAFEEESEEKENDVFEKNDQESNDAVNESEEKAEDDEAAAMFAALKKKKKKKKTSADEEQPEQEAVTEIGEFGDLSTMKKKRKKKPDLAVFEKQLKEGDEEEGNQEGVDLFAPEGEEENEKKETHGEETWLASDRDYTYQELLGRVFKILRQNNPELAGEKKRYTIVPPSVHREGNKKTIFANVGDICKRMHRQPEHVIQFLFAEMGTSGSIDGSQRLVIKGRFQQKQIENVLRRYIVEYVTCKTCKSPDTILTKENRIFFMQCESCGSTRSVSAIKSGFHAQTEKRAAQRRAAQ